MPENRVTELKAALKDKNRINVFVDKKFKFSLTLEQVVDLKIKVGRKFSEEELQNIEAESEFGKFYQRTLEYVLLRPRSEKEVRDHLVQKKFKREVEWKRYENFLDKLKNDEDYREKVLDIKKKVRDNNSKLKDVDFTVDNRYEYIGRHSTGLPHKPGAKITDENIERVIKKLCDSGFINDENFARFYIENKNIIKGTSIKKLKLGLRKKGVSESVINTVLLENDFGETLRDDVTEIRKIIEKKRSKNIDETKIAQYLARQGFSYDLIKSELGL